VAVCRQRAILGDRSLSAGLDRSGHSVMWTTKKRVGPIRSHTSASEKCAVAFW